MLMARRGLMDVAEAHERGGAGGGAPAGDNEQGDQDPGKQGEQKEQPKGDDEYAGMTQEELLAEAAHENAKAFHDKCENDTVPS